MDKKNSIFVVVCEMRKWYDWKRKAVGKITMEIRYITENDNLVEISNILNGIPVGKREKYSD